LLVFIFESEVVVSQLSCHVLVSASLIVNFLPQFISFSHLLVDLLSHQTIILGNSAIDVSCSGDLLLSVLIQNLLISKIVILSVNLLLHVLNPGLSSSQIVVQCLQSLCLVIGLFGSNLIELLKLVDLSPVISSLLLQHLEFTLKVVLVLSQVRVVVALLAKVIVQTSCLVVLLF
jgi:hypothetical protein